MKSGPSDSLTEASQWGYSTGMPVLRRLRFLFLLWVGTVLKQSIYGTTSKSAKLLKVALFLCARTAWCFFG